VTAAANQTRDEQTAPVDDADENVSVTGVDRRTVDMTIDALSAEGQQFVTETGARPAGYIQVDHSIAESDIDGATHHFRVRKSYLNATGVGPQAVQLYRDEPDEWNDLETSYAGESGEFFHYTADSPGLSLFTIGAHTPVFEIRNAHVVEGGITTGQPFHVNVTVANVGNANGTYTTRLVADGSVVDTQPIDITANGSREVQLQHTFETGGNHTLSIGNLEFQRVTATSEGLPWFIWLLIALGAVSLLLFFVWRRRDDDEEQE
jgi:hypothetical protein